MVYEMSPTYNLLPTTYYLYLSLGYALCIDCHLFGLFGAFDLSA